MKTKVLMTALLILSGAIGCAPTNKQEDQRLNLDSTGLLQSDGKPVTLISRYTGGDYISATYSFRHLTRDNVELTRNNWEVIFEAREDFEDHFSVNMVVDDNSFIYDLGQRSCQDIQSHYPENRKQRPLSWLAYSDADPSELEPTKDVLVKEGHCYLTYNNDQNGRVVALFRVKSHEKSRSVTIDEIEVLDVLSRKN